MTDRFTRLGLAVGAVLIAAGMAAAVYAASPGPGGGPPPFNGRGRGPGREWPMGAFGPLGMMVSRLDLGTPREIRSRDIVQAHQTDIQAFAKNESVARQALDAAELATEPDATIIQLHTNLAAIEADMAVADIFSPKSPGADAGTTGDAEVVSSRCTARPADASAAPGEAGRTITWERRSEKWVGDGFRTRDLRCHRPAFYP